MPDVQEVYEMVTKLKPPEPGALERQQKRQVRAARNKKIGAFAMAAAIGVAAIALILTTRQGDGATTPAREPAVAVDPTAEEVARDFLEAFGAFHAEQAMTFVADDADLTGMEGFPYQASGGVVGFSRLTSFLKAFGWKQTITSCEATASTLATDTFVVCTFDFHGLRSDEIGRGPFSGSSFTITVRDSKIVEASWYWDIQRFSQQMWDPFAAWVSSAHPEDVAVMYQDGQTNFRLTEESIRLWELRSKEYVKEVKATAGQ
jgi:hypothetical protein